MRLRRLASGASEDDVPRLSWFQAYAWNPVKAPSFLGQEYAEKGSTQVSRAEYAQKVAAEAQAVAEVVRRLAIAHPAIRSRGTVVGSIAHADPAYRQWLIDATARHAPG